MVLKQNATKTRLSIDLSGRVKDMTLPHIQALVAEFLEKEKK